MSAYLRPATLEEALEALADGAAVPAAGCTDLFPATESPVLDRPVVDLTGVAGLRGVTETGEGWTIGATTTWADIAKADLPPAFDMLRAAAREVGSVQIQNAATVAGNLCNASPAADGVPPLLALDAGVEIAARSGRRHLPLAEFLAGPRKTALRPGEVVSAVTVPRASTVGRSRFLKLGARRYLVISIASVAARLVVRDGAVETVALAVGACGPVPVRLTAAEAALAGRPVAGLAGALDERTVRSALSPISDMRGDAAYRAEAAVALVRRALAGLATEEGS